MSITLSRIIFTGADAANFLQSQLSADIHALDFATPNPNNAGKNIGLAALCNRQGRTIALLWLIEQDKETFHALLPSDMAETVQKHLQIFVFRSKVTMTIDTPSEEDLSTLPAGLSIPWINAKTTEKYVPQMLSLDLLKGVNFKKGCYPGQEIVARMHYLGTYKRRLAKFRSATPEEFIIDAEIVDENGKEVAVVVYSEGDEALAVLRLEGKDRPLKINSPVEIVTIWHEEESEEE